MAACVEYGGRCFVFLTETIEFISKAESIRVSMYKLDIPLDLKEKAAIERRRRAEQERQGRIFNSRHRQIGVSRFNRFHLAFAFARRRFDSD